MSVGRLLGRKRPLKLTKRLSLSLTKGHFQVYPPHPEHDHSIRSTVTAGFTGFTGRYDVTFYYDSKCYCPGEPGK